MVDVVNSRESFQFKTTSQSFQVGENMIHRIFKIWPDLWAFDLVIHLRGGCCSPDTRRSPSRIHRGITWCGKENLRRKGYPVSAAKNRWMMANKDTKIASGQHPSIHIDWLATYLQNIPFFGNYLKYPVAVVLRFKAGMFFRSGWWVMESQWLDRCDSAPFTKKP